MRKSVLLILLAIFIGSIVWVGYFGLSSVFNEVTTYAREIIITNDGIVQEPHGKVLFFHLHDSRFWDVGLNEQGETEWAFRYRLRFEVLPENTTNKNVNFTFDTTQSHRFRVDQNGIVTILVPGEHLISIIAADGHGARADISFVVWI